MSGRSLGLRDFLGHWQLHREIRHADGSDATLEGRAEWRAEGGGASVIESGRMMLAEEGPFDASRLTRWDRDLRVFFADGRFFHQVPPNGGAACHLCDPDRYEAWYDFAGWPHWSCRWQVTGPRKRYRMISRYRPWPGIND